MQNTVSKEELIKNYNELEKEILFLKGKQTDIKRALKNLHEHKVGEIVIFKRAKKAECEMKAVVFDVQPKVWDDNVIFSYRFKQLKKDGTLSRYELYLDTDEILWTGEIFKRKEDGLTFIKE